MKFTTPGKAQLICLTVAVVVLGPLVGCSSSSSSSNSEGSDVTQNQPQEETVNGYSINEYNSDISNLERILSDAIYYYDAIEAMGDPSQFFEQAQVDEYNSYVDQYNAAADSYNDAATTFSKKYGMTIDGVSGTPVNPYAIDIPAKK